MRIAVVDSGICGAHPHVNGIAGGVSVCEGAASTADTTDRIGHGTAVAAAIREKAPDAALYAVKVFDRTLSTSLDRLVRAIRWSADAGADVINLSLGTPRAEHAAALSEAIAYATARRAVIVAAAASDGISWLPGSLEGVIPVRLDWTCPREQVRVPAGACQLLASGFPRPIPGVPPHKNLTGISFAVANASGLVARVLQELPAAPPGEVIAALAQFAWPASALGSSPIV